MTNTVGRDVGDGVTPQCLVCKEQHKAGGQQTRSPWQISIPVPTSRIANGAYLVCRRCCEAGKDARQRAEREANDAGGTYFDNFIDGNGR